MRTSFRIFIRACINWSDNGDSRLGAALAYYTLFSIAPLLVIAIHVAGAVFGADAANGQVEQQLTEVVGGDAAKAIQTLVVNASHRKSSWAPIISYALLLAAALGMFLHIRDSFRTIWKLEDPHYSVAVQILLNYVLALLMVVVVVVLLVASLTAGLVVSFCYPWLVLHFPEVPWQFSEIALSFLLMTFLFAATFYILSGRVIRLGYVWYGALISAVLFSLGKSAIVWYLGVTSAVSAYGAASSLVGLLIWVYYSAQILFFGAELVQARRTRREWMDHLPPAPPANSVTG